LLRADFGNFNEIGVYWQVTGDVEV